MAVLKLASYQAKLRDHLRLEGPERTLLYAYELGRELMENGAGVLDVVRLHADALARLDEEEGTRPLSRPRADTFLAEVLAPFEMAYLGFQEAVGSLRQLASSLEEQVEARTRELQTSLSSLQVAEAERQRLLARVIAAEEQERQRIADDLHDDTIQVMAMASLRLSRLRGHLDNEESESIAEAVESAVADTIGRLRRMVFELRPPMLERDGLAAALRTYLRAVMDDGPEWTLHDLLDQQPALEVSETAYRIAQEALANVRKHAGAQRVDVTLETVDQGLRIAIVDDGAGFDVRLLDMPRVGHLGSMAMRERAALRSGWCRIASEPDQGTTVTMWLPLVAPDAERSRHGGAGHRPPSDGSGSRSGRV